MVKLKNIIVGSALVLSISSLSGCSQFLESINSSDKPLAPSNEETVDINGQKIKLPDNSLVTGDDSKESSQPLLEEGFKAVGDDEYGWFQIPEEFVNFVEVSNPNSIAKQFAKGDKSFILTFNPLPTEAKHEDLVMNLVEHMRTQGPSVVATPTEVNGNKATELFQYFENEDYTWHVWIIEEGDTRKYISMEYSGEQEDLKDKILKSYSDTEPVANNSASHETGKIPSSTKSTLNLTPLTDNFKEVHVSKENVNIHVFGEFKEGSTYYASMFDKVDFETIAHKELEPTKSEDGSFYLNLDLELEGELKPVKYSVDIIEVDKKGFFERVEFTVK